MIKLTTRENIIKSKSIIGSELTKMQKAFFDEGMLQYYKDSNEENLYLETFDFIMNEEKEYPTFNKVIGLFHSDIDTFVEKLTEKITELFQAINVTNFIIISNLKVDFFGNRENKFKPLVSSYKKLEKIVGQKSYKEAFEFDIESLPEFIEILFWTTRCDMSISEYVFLFDKNEKLQFCLSKYGNIYVTEFEKEQLTEKVLTSLNWKIIEDQEKDNFSTSGKINGRKLKM